jgi:hypothetical protein
MPLLHVRTFKSDLKKEGKEADYELIFIIHGKFAGSAEKTHSKKL